MLFQVEVSYADSHPEETHLFGHVVSSEGPVPYAAVTVKGTTRGATTDETGHYILTEIPSGEIEVVVSCVGYKSQVKKVTVTRGIPQELDFHLEEDVLSIDQVVVTGDRIALRRQEASTVISTLSPKLMALNNSSSISEGLPFLSGVRTENNCQNCGFNQVRLNGLEGPYSQILIEGQPIFSGLLGVYGLEMIPANMVSRIEVQRGGGSTLYGSSAVAGTVNVLLQNPMYNAFSAAFTTGFIGVGMPTGGGVKPEYNVNFNASALAPNNRTGLSVYGDFRERQPFDYDHDGFSELPRLRNISVGSRLFQRVGARGNFTLNYFHITERRRGGDVEHKPHHEADIAEAVMHHVNCAAGQYTQRFREEDMLTLNASMQHVKRDSYYGGGHDLGAYGYTRDLSANVSAQYSARFDFGGRLITGIDYQHERLRDTKLGHSEVSAEMGATSQPELKYELVPDVSVANQRSFTLGEYIQYSQTLGIAMLTGGVRMDYFSVQDLHPTEDGGRAKPYSGFAPVPRASLLLNVLPELQLRANYSMGYRKPQVFDEDLHVEVAANARRILHENAPDLKHEVSHSAMLSLDYNRQFERWAVGFLVEGFYTRLQNAFVQEEDEERSNDYEKYFMRKNNPHGAQTYGVNAELNVAPHSTLALKAGMTWHRAEFIKVEGDDNHGVKSFLRSPNTYGYITGDWKIWRGLSLASTLNVTGRMLVPYEGGTTKNAEEEALRAADEECVLIRRTPIFADLSLKLNYTFNLRSADLSLFAGVKNALNSWQKDWDSGVDRDSGYTYGPTFPRMVYVGLRLGNLL